jgi:hypothetical protein
MVASQKNPLETAKKLSLKPPKKTLKKPTKNPYKTIKKLSKTPKNH